MKSIGPQKWLHIDICKRKQEECKFRKRLRKGNYFKTYSCVILNCLVNENENENTKFLEHPVEDITRSETHNRSIVLYLNYVSLRFILKHLS